MLRIASDTYDGCLIVAHVQIETLTRDLFTVDLSEISEIVISESERIRFHGT